MIVCENRALFECIRDRCKRTGAGTVLCIVIQTRFSDNLFFLSSTVLLLTALMHEFAWASQAIIHAAFKSKKPELFSRSYEADRASYPADRYSLYQN
jgi:hypothetical protein